jgi:hypothetical protein
MPSHRSHRHRSAKGRGKVARVMRERKHGTLKSKSGRKVKSRKQAVAIALNEARRSGAHIPKKRSSSRSRSRSRSKS